MQHPRTKRWHCDDCYSPYQQKEHLEKHYLVCKQHQAVLADKAKAAPPVEPVADAPFNAPMAEAYAERKAARAKGKKE